MLYQNCRVEIILLPILVILCDEKFNIRHNAKLEIALSLLPFVLFQLKRHYLGAVLLSEF
jgi:hypothetical protein